MPSVVGPIGWEMQRDSEGHRTYKLTTLVRGETTDGPANIIQTAGLPIPGAVWQVLGDIDVYAWCRADASVRQVVRKEPGLWWEVENTFSTKPPEASKSRCQDTRIEDPLLEPQKISGTFTKGKEEATHDRFGAPIHNSAWEQLRGPQNEWDFSRPQVKIEQNVPLLQLGLVASLIDNLNDAPLWGLPARSVKFSDFSWERKFYGSCYVYYTRQFTFDVAYRTVATSFGTLVLQGAWDRDLLDEGTKVLKGRWNSQGTWELRPVGEAPLYNIQPDPNNPAHFIRFKDRNDEATRVILNGRGVPYDPESTGTGDDVIGSIHVEKYQQADLLQLGIPLML